MKKGVAKRLGRETRHTRIRARVTGTPVRPRLAVYKSNRYLHAQIIDDTVGKTLVSGSTKDARGNAKKMDAAKNLGAELAKRAKAAGITAVVFDRGGFRYTGRVATLAQAVREAGLKL
ncbi:MAG: 50S ribosomal protein L18 [Candidatus Adlerbacteria bacterium]|nr:50S ribosomal protein L18 [Candidatus Adlerbacteria bacterium]MDZ4226380.1 50S ribosomal protein L18 [Patescibacteria group bacterium]